MRAASRRRGARPGCDLRSQPREEFSARAARARAECGRARWPRSRAPRRLRARGAPPGEYGGARRVFRCISQARRRQRCNRFPWAAWWARSAGPTRRTSSTSGRQSSPRSGSARWCAWTWAVRSRAGCTAWWWTVRATPISRRRCTTTSDWRATPRRRRPRPRSGRRSDCTRRRCSGTSRRSRSSPCPPGRSTWPRTRTCASRCAWTRTLGRTARRSRWGCTRRAGSRRRSTWTRTSSWAPRPRT